MIEADLLKTGFLGEEEELTYKGRKTGETIKRKNPLIKMFVAKKFDPAYRDNSSVIGINAAGDVAVSFSEPERESSRLLQDS
jgi:hypothetical protein